MLGKIVEPLATPFDGFKFFATSRAEERAAALDQIAHAPRGEFFDLVVEHTLITVVDSEDFDALEKRRPNHRARRRVHARAVAAGSHYRYRILNSHFLTSSFELTTKPHFSIDMI